jgi:MFS transporter, SP family, solute carrier family 2 (myo-inositol transporter), member 13
MSTSQNSPVSLSKSNAVFYGRFLLFIAGLGGLLYGIDVGIIAAALLYLNKTVNLSVEQTSLIVAAVLGGSMLSSPIAGVLGDWLGRKKMMLLGGVMFVASVGLIVLSQGFASLFVGRLLQGASGGVIAVAVPLYLAETLRANRRGQGTAIFQFMLTFGIVLAALIGWYYTRQTETAISLAAGNSSLILAAENHAWRGMFLAVVYPGLIFFAGTFFLSESPRWLMRTKRTDAAYKALLRSHSEEEAQLEMAEMQALVQEKTARTENRPSDSLFQRKYVIPFLLACFILAVNQATGINSVLAFLVVILKQAGMAATHATQGDVIVKVLNCVVTLIGVALVEKKGRKFLLKLGTGGVVLSLLAGAVIFYGFESKRVDIKEMLQTAETGNTLTMAVNPSGGKVMSLTALYNYGQGDRIATVLSNDENPTLTIKPEAKEANAPLLIKSALYGPVPKEKTGWLVTICLAVFISSYAVGPGVVVWLMLSELMPTRIRSTGMGIAMLLNQGVATLIAGIFLPVVGNHGYYAMFLFLSGCTVSYFLVATFLLPETKGKTLEEIEMHFEGTKAVS